MPVTQDRLARLRGFGFSEYAARAYLALLDLGTAEARDVSSISKVPQAKIYHVLEQLHEKGLVVILPEFPKKYVPVPFEDYLQRLHDEHRKQAELIEAEREALAEMFAVVGDTEVGDRGFFTVLRGRRNVLSKIEEMVSAASSDLLVLGTAGTAGRAPGMARAIQAARERGVGVRFMVPLDEETLEKVSPLAEFAEVRARDLGDEEQSANVAIVLVDRSQAFLVHFVPDDENLYVGKDIGVFTDQEAMVAAVQAIVEPVWRRAPDLEKLRSQVSTADGSRPAPSDELGLGILFHQMPDAGVVTDLDGRVVAFNESAGALFGYDEAQAKRLRLEALFAGPAQKSVASALARVASGKPGREERLEAVGSRKDGAEFRLDVRLGRFGSDPERHHVLAVLRDEGGS